MYMESIDELIEKARRYDEIKQKAKESLKKYVSSKEGKLKRQIYNRRYYLKRKAAKAALK
jgi:hypothetical protein